MADRSEVEKLVAARASNDAAFKQKLTANPKAVMEEMLGGQLPASVKVSVLVEDDNNIYIVLPQDAATSDLAGVAGGCWIGASGSCSFVTG